MGKLVIESLEKRIRVKKVAKAVYKVLGQKDNLKAELVFDSAKEIQALNRTTRGVDGVTDVLSYPSLSDICGVVLNREEFPNETEGRFLFIGSIVLCEDKIKSQAKELNHSYEKERNYLIVHGLLHLLGYDHMVEEDKTKMREKEKEIIKLIYGSEEV